MGRLLEYSLKRGVAARLPRRLPEDDAACLRLRLQRVERPARLRRTAPPRHDFGYGRATPVDPAHRLLASYARVVRGLFGEFIGAEAVPVRAYGNVLTMIAYPHGKADDRAARAARAAGYELCLAGSPNRVDPTTDPLLIGRVEAQALTLRDFPAALAAIPAADDRTPVRA